jgi:predicted metalloprotease with PDZ domain
MNLYIFKYKTSTMRHTFYILYFIIFAPQLMQAQSQQKQIHFQISMPEAVRHLVHVKMTIQQPGKDTLIVKLPKWTTGYYQLMKYDKNLSNFTVKINGQPVNTQAIASNAWKIVTNGSKPVVIDYDVLCNRKFVANSYVDTAHAFLLFSSLLLYIDQQLNNQASVTVSLPAGWNQIATGLAKSSAPNTYYAVNFDQLYDCPMLLGNLEKLPSFEINNKQHHFIGYQLGNFDKDAFMQDLKKIIETATKIFNDIPYNEYTFLAIGPGRGGIEHSNSAAVSFSGNELNTPSGKNRMMTFLTHEYFHHYNIKRIRPLELGPFDYDKENRTNLLWVSEGLSVYYQYIIARRAGVIDEDMILGNFSSNITNYENHPGKRYQSLVQASYNTWSDGPNGNIGKDPNKAISYYEKGPIVGLLLDLAIRSSTHNQRSLDDVMYQLYWTYYKRLQRGFTDAELQEACENIAGTSLMEVFEYVYTTKEIEYTTYLEKGGLQLEAEVKNGKTIYRLVKKAALSAEQEAIYNSLFK